jgi:hypothetical protein
VPDGRGMPTRQAALKLVRGGHTYQEAGLRLGTPPGLVYLAATGVPTCSLITAFSTSGSPGSRRSRLYPAAQGA